MINNNETQERITTHSSDQQLASELIESMYAGIALMGQAQHKAMSKDALDLAEKLQKTHTKLTEELKMYESDQGWLIPAGEKDEDVNKRQEMAKKNGEEYEQAWLSALRDRHETNIRKLEIAEPEDPKLKRMGEKSLSTLKDLLSDILNVQASVA